MKIRSHKDLDVYRIAFESANLIFELTKIFPKEEKYSPTDQIRRSSRSVCANISEAFRKRRYPKSFISKIVDSEAEAAETQTWLDFALECEYLSPKLHSELFESYNRILGKLVSMARQSDKWTV